ncbi:MAG: cysteine--tRNA ligase [Candidatus Woykebacteria bacterium RIFCSPHIGHO2_12_FULL_45_10]|uniref:Cysteine--tRNA ligase n=1 Tax=Candidatus Woykebacteria bacterium RIFCSPHIGHO2_12_FULL_45_10 TaxID=1802603 RepID=A0A1G1WQH2_9BACT|nr:MAG: cysteine--tRNA ligase [Candidatus Woykebacteria bacterium RIFCSPHIGHO2_12_FULL_45_10]
MAEIFLTNTLTRKKEKFVPNKAGEVGIYTCGPTVYRNVHIGNLRTYISADILKRVFIYNGYTVKHIKNITDVGHMRTTGADEAYDPVITEAIKEGKTPLEIAESYTKAYREDEEKLNIIPADENPKATDHIPEMIELIQKLIANGLAYEAEGNIYFKVKEFKDYGKLSGNTLDKMDQLLQAVRVSVETDKKDSADFALWKRATGDRAMVWDSPWGKGFPGWHIECSAMSMKYLGENFDIHTGAEDLIFPHHEDEIAQSEGATGKKFVSLWSHAGFLLVEGEKMARSANNFVTLNEIIGKGFQPLAFRYLCLTTHYKSRLNFTWKGLEASQEALNNLYREVSSYSEPKIGCAEYEQRFLEAINDDLNTPEALSIVWELVKSDYPDSAKLQSLLRFDEILGFGLSELVQSNNVPDKVTELVNEREKARAEKDFARSDKLRKEIAESGFEVVDTDLGPKLKKIIQG